MHVEVVLRAPGLRFTGRADVIHVTDESVSIIDYKTGAPGPHHEEQLRVYAVLWRNDLQLNPNGREATSLILAYPTHDEVHEAPGASDLTNLEQDLGGRIVEVEGSLALRPPPAWPSTETCRYCAVKHLCNEYWSTLPMDSPEPVRQDHGAFIDLEVTIVERNGPRSYRAENSRQGADILLRTPTEAPPFSEGDQVRLVGVARVMDEEARRWIATITPGTEVYVTAPLVD
jgi:hypothetical protein